MINGGSEGWVLAWLGESQAGWRLALATPPPYYFGFKFFFFYYFLRLHFLCARVFSSHVCLCLVHSGTGVLGVTLCVSW